MRVFWNSSKRREESAIDRLVIMQIARELQFIKRACESFESDGVGFGEAFASESFS